ncbi:hypothetical protein [Endozoicomonas atrinae]|uniref:hypothetical protein n=1 Tax=Endozoicomonas atrinae TaxID=1333660 RepID=UPI003B00E560
MGTWTKVLPTLFEQLQQRSSEKSKQSKKNSDSSSSYIYKISAKTGSRQYWMEILKAVLNDKKNAIPYAVIAKRLNVLFSKLDNGAYRCDPKNFDTETFLSLITDDLHLYGDTRLTEEIIDSLTLYDVLIPETLFEFRQCFDKVQFSNQKTKKPREIMAYVNSCLQLSGSRFRLSPIKMGFY